jgi:predicted transcriptional regulator
MLNIISESDTKGDTRTSITYKTFLSHAQLKKYLSFLLENGLVEEIPQQIKTSGSGKKLVYKISEKGLRFLQISQEFESLIGLD